VFIGFAVVQGISVNFQGQVPHYESSTIQTNQQSSVIWGANESNPGSPIRIRLGISTPPSLDKTAELLAVVTCAMDASDVEVHIILPEGFVMTSGDPDWKGSVLHDQKVELRYTLKSVQVGDWIIEGFVKYSFAQSFYTDRDRIYISVSENSAYISTTTFSQKTTTGIPPGNETKPSTSIQPGGDSTLLPTQQSGELVMFVSPTLVAVGDETTITISYGISSMPSGTQTAPGVMVRGGKPSFEGPLIVTYGPTMAEDGEEWVAKIKPTSAGLIKVNGQDESGTLHVYAEIKVVESLPPPLNQPSMENIANRYGSAAGLLGSGAASLSLIVALAAAIYSRHRSRQLSSLHS